ncbi:MAG: GDSL-type esterase/lipase family protein [Chitinophagaceae bacterium]
MMKKLSIIIAIVLQIIAIAPVSVHAQQLPFWNEIQAFKKQDSLHFPPKNAILFVGSSSFRYWTDVQDYFPGYTIINRGFGGSSLPHVIAYADDVIFPYHPRQVVVYCGENDVTEDSVTGELVAQRFITLFQLIRKKQPGVPVAFVSLKPSPSRSHLFPKMIKANELIRAFIKKQSKAVFIDVYSLMLNADGTPRKELFKEDNLHMNKTGYEIWQKAIQPHLLKD